MVLFSVRRTPFDRELKVVCFVKEKKKNNKIIQGPPDRFFVFDAVIDSISLGPDNII